MVTNKHLRLAVEKEDEGTKWLSLAMETDEKKISKTREDGILYSSCNYFVILLDLLFSRPIFSHSTLCSSFAESLIALSFPFLIEHFSKAGLPYSRNE